MKYFLFVSFNTGLDHNALYGSLVAVRESLEQLATEEGLDETLEVIPKPGELEKHFESLKDDFYGGLSNGTWFHIQEVPEENILEVFKEKTYKS